MIIERLFNNSLFDKNENIRKVRCYLLLSRLLLNRGERGVRWAGGSLSEPERGPVLGLAGGRPQRPDSEGSTASTGTLFCSSPVTPVEANSPNVAHLTQRALQTHKNITCENFSSTKVDIERYRILPESSVKQMFYMLLHFHDF